MRTKTRLFYVAALAVAFALAAVILVRYQDSVTAATGDNLVTTSQVTTTGPPRSVTTTTTTVPDPDLVAAYDYAAVLWRAEVAAFLNAWWGAELDAYFGAIRDAQAAENARRVRSTVPARPGPARVNVAPNPPRSSGSAPGGFLACVRQRESRGNYTAVNGSSGAAGAYQFMPQTARNTAMHAGRPDLAGRPVTSWSPADQDAMAQHLYQWQGPGPWAASAPHAC